MYYILLHPCFFLLATIITLVASYRIKILFQIFSTIYPILLLIQLCYFKGTCIATFNNINIRADFEDPYKLIAIGSALAALIANLYCLAEGRRLEIIICAVGLCLMQAGLFASDYISLYMSIELLMIIVSVLMFLGTGKNNINSVKHYFLTHLFSGCLILIGFCFFINETNSTEIAQLTNLVNLSNKKLMIFYYLLMLGCLINIGMFPLSAWMVNCYPVASNTSFMYIAAIFSKLSFVVIMKLFSTAEILKYFGIVMMLHGGLFSYLESNSKRVFCYLSITQFGLLIIYISKGSPNMLMSASIILFWNILYKSLLALILGIVDDGVQTNNSEQAKYRRIFSTEKILICVVAICFIFVANIPIISPIFAEKALLNDSNIDKLTYYSIIASNVLSICAFMNIFLRKDTIRTKIKVNKSRLYLLILVIVIILGCLIGWKYLIGAIFSLRNNTILNSYMLYKQLAIIIFSLCLVIILPKLQANTTWWNLDLFVITDRIIDKFYAKSSSDASERWYFLKKLNFLSFINRSYKRVNIIYDQSLAIGTIFILLIFLIIKHIKI